MLHWCSVSENRMGRECKAPCSGPGLPRQLCAWWASGLLPAVAAPCKQGHLLIPLLRLMHMHTHEHTCTLKQMHAHTHVNTHAHVHMHTHTPVAAPGPGGWTCGPMRPSFWQERGTPGASPDPSSPAGGAPAAADFPAGFLRGSPWLEWGVVVVGGQSCLSKRSPFLGGSPEIGGKGEP